MKHFFVDVRLKSSKFEYGTKKEFNDNKRELLRNKIRKHLVSGKYDLTLNAITSLPEIDELSKNKDTFITTEVGQHQMWAAQHYKFNKPNRWMTSGGLGTMGYGLPAAVGVQIAHPDKLVVDIAGEASVLMTMQEMSTAVQYKLPIKIFILNKFNYSN